MSTFDSNCNVGASKSSDEDVCDVNDMLQNMSTEYECNDACANCGKEGGNLKACTACKQVKYCNRECQIAHRPMHKKECRKRAAELHDEELFKQPPSEDDCPICFQQLPFLYTGRRYYTCCGKEICGGCVYAPRYDNLGNKVDKEKCPFCRTPNPTSKEAVEWLRKRVEANDILAINNLGNYYRGGLNGYPQAYDKALEYWHKAVELGYSAAYCAIGDAYDDGEGVEVDRKKANHYWELAAMKGHARARYHLGYKELIVGHMNRALKHLIIAVRGGYARSLEVIQRMYKDGYASKEDYTKALQAYQVYLGEIKSAQRDKAVAAHEEYRYY